MKKLLFIIISLTLTICSWTQEKNRDISTDPAGNPIYYSASISTPYQGLALTIDKSTKWIEYYNTISNQPLTNFVFLEGTKEIGLSLLVPKDSVQYYRYSIIEDNVNWLVSDATPDSSLKKFNFRKLVQLELGKFAVANKTLTVEIYKITERNKVATVTIYNKPIKPAELFLTLMGITTKKGQSGFSMDNQKDGFKIKIHDTVNVNSILLSIKPSVVTFIYHVYLKNLSSGKKYNVSNNWNYGYINVYPYLTIDADYFSNPGDYEISIIPQLSSGFNAKSFPSMATKIHFTVLKSARTFSQKEMLVGIVIILIAAGVIAGLVIYFIKRNNKHKLRAEQQQKEYARMQLSLVRSQLNPHFMFNALSGIQNLMNKNEPDQANRYLTKFARLTRSVLTNKDLISLTEERELLDDYLQMEQLRFGFKYAIEFDPQLEPANTEIPAMLLQPIVENAVKHGIAELGENGIINIKMIQRNNDLVIFIIDNGKGFDISEASNGLGLTLTKNRIALLNSIYKGPAITLDIKSEPLNTTVTVTLFQWL